MSLSAFDAPLDAAGRFRRRVASTPRSVRPADPVGLLRLAPRALPVLFDFAQPVRTWRGPALLLTREAMRFVLWPDGRWASDCGRMAGGGLVTLVMAAADVDAVDGLVLVNAAAALGTAAAEGRAP